MKVSAPHDVPTHLLQDPDSYITRIGRILRKTILDEIPQIYQIFIGKMSFVGERDIIVTNKKNIVFSRVLVAPPAGLEPATS